MKARPVSNEPDVPPSAENTTISPVHEGAYGLASASDTRLPVSGAAGVGIVLNQVRFGSGVGEILDEERSLDFRTGIFRRIVRWRAPDGKIFRLCFERLAGLERSALFAQRVRIAPEHGSALVSLAAALPAPVANVPGAAEIYDPRIGPALAHNPWIPLRAGKQQAGQGDAGDHGAGEDGTPVFRVDRLANSGFEVAAAMSVTGAGERVITPENGAELTKFQAFASDRGQPGPHPVEAVTLEALAMARATGYVHATGDEAFLDAYGVEMLIETARIWLAIGHYSDHHGGQFCIDRVTGPDEYSALVDNNYFTNAMAKAHLLDAVSAAEAIARRNGAEYAALLARIDLRPEEFPRMRRAAEKMRLPIDPVLGIIAQDDAFLHKEVWDFAGTAPEKYPLLLHHHPLGLYRRQVCKQADAVLALTLAGEGLDPQMKRRTFDYYEAVTTHDSTLSPACFAIAAAEIGYLAKAFDYLCMSAYVDLEDLCGNAAHGLHMAALAGSWQALAFGFAGVRIDAQGLSVAPQFYPALGPCTLRLRFRGRRLRLEIGALAATCHLEEGESLAVRTPGGSVLVEPGRAAPHGLWSPP